MIRGVILDLDGTVYFGTDETPGASRFVAACRKVGIRCLFVTNRANREPREIADQLRGFGIPCELDDVLTAAQATALYLRQGSAWYIGEEGLRIALEEQGIVITEDRPDYVVVSYDRGFNYEKLFKACRLIDGGAKFIATNPDVALKTEKGIYPGTGAIVEAVAAGCGRRPVVVGKPERLIMDMALERLGMKADEVITVGDSLATDVPAGKTAGIRTVLILTGVSKREEIDASAVKPDWVVETFEELGALVTRGRLSGGVRTAGGTRNKSGTRASRLQGDVETPRPSTTIETGPHGTVRRSGDGARAKARSGTRASRPQGDVAERIARLGLKPHPEGGWYCETYRSDMVVKGKALPKRFGGDRAASTAIYFLLVRDSAEARTPSHGTECRGYRERSTASVAPAVAAGTSVPASVPPCSSRDSGARGDFSAFHRIKSDEVWHLYEGGPVWIHCLSPSGAYSRLVLGGPDGLPQQVVPAGTWFAAELADGVDYALTGCTVAPGFDFADFEMAKGDDLARQFPRHRDLIARLTR